jgi:hypothetical protein
VRAGIILEPLNQRLDLFRVLVAFSWWFHSNARKLFGEISVRL